MTSQPTRLSNNFVTLIPSLTITDYEWFPWSICNGCGMPAGKAYPSGHLVPAPVLGRACAPIVETRFLELAMSLLDFSPRMPVGTFSILLPIVHFPWLIGDVPRLPSYGIYISQFVRFAICCTSVLDLHYKNLQITSKLLTQGNRYHKLRNTFGKFFRSYSELLSKFGDISFQEYVSKGISHPVRAPPSKMR